jgi:DNA-binding NtrC family response regulator
MFNYFFKNNVPDTLSVEQLKRTTKVLIIDDEEPKELRELLKKEGWKNYYLNDLDALSNKKLEESHVVCIDIMGVGKKLQVQDGMGLVKHIKKRYPEKKIILYSSVSKQDIFSDAIDHVDKRLRKESSLVPFIIAIEEMAANTFSWEQTVKYAYLQVKDTLGETIEYEAFRDAAEKSITTNGWNPKTFMKKSGVGLDVASKIASLVALALGGS